MGYFPEFPINYHLRRAKSRKQEKKVVQSYKKLRNCAIEQRRENMVKWHYKKGGIRMQLWTYEHAITVLPGLAVMFLMAFVLRRLLKDKPYGVRMIPISVIATILLLMEVGKQGVSLSRGYDLYCLPFHFCSLFIFMLPLMAFYKGRGAKTIAAITTALCMSVFLLMLIYPNLIYGSWNVTGYFEDYTNFHTVTFHLLVMLAAVLILALELYEPLPKGEVKALILYILGFCVVSASMAHILKTNYANYYTCNIPVLEQVRLAVAAFAGEVPAKLLYITIVSGLNVVFVYGAQRVCLLCHKLLNRKKVPVK